ncbi:aromatic ring-hydroxylating dioxygenase subunit alpha [Sphingomicrobium sp. XHP0239]|uniref:aromatic ring-hydroxylating oxygenase subunit alpha n=1 Tax=Sphingomicrobium maritimum TaxID=3133972 RepID=UPI0031CC8D4A
MPTSRLRMTPGQRALAERMLRGDHDIGDEARRIETKRYIDPERHVRELAHCFRGFPTALCPSALIGPDQMIRHDASGLDLIVARDRDGAIHVLGNSCAHRATRLVDEDGVLPARKIVCPYHAWTYRPNGDLAALPRPEAFPGLCKEDHALKTYPAREIGGLVWFYGDGSGEDFSPIEPLGPDLDAIGLDAMRFYRRNLHTVAADWKMIVDAFSESYHVKRLHARSIGEFFADGVAVMDRMGPHQRFIVGRAGHAEPVDLDDWQAVRETMTFTYQIFPNTVVVVSPDYVNVLIVHPTSAGRCKVEDFMLVPDVSDAEAKALEGRWSKSWELLDQHTFGGEDFRAAALCQRGVEAGLRDEMIVGTLENGMIAFHDELDARLA